MKGDQYDYDPVSLIQTTTLKATALDGTLPVHVDGETLCTEGKELDVTLLKRQIDLIVEIK
jgi:hypothetical protein